MAVWKVRDVKTMAWFRNWSAAMKSIVTFSKRSKTFNNTGVLPAHLSAGWSGLCVAHGEHLGAFFIRAVVSGPHTAQWTYNT